MSIQYFYAAPSAIPFPQFMRGTGGLVIVTATQLRKVFWHAPAQKLVGVFATTAIDYEILSPGNSDLGLSWRLMYLWRDGTPVDIASTAIRGFAQIFLEVTHTASAQVVMRNIQGDVARDELSAAQGDALFPLSERWAMDILPVRTASAAVLGERYDASYLTTTSAGYVVVNSVAQGTFRVLAKPTNSVAFSATGTTWRHPRDLLYIDGAHTAATFMQDSGGTINASVAALVRLFRTTSSPWTLLWTDTLPEVDSVATYDPQYEILYSCSKWPGAVLHASKLTQSPASLSVLTLVSGSTLHELRPALVSLLVTDSQGSGLSGVLVQWTLSASVSGGSLQSAFTRTNASGIAAVTYLGPRLSGSTITETVCAAVATLDPVET